MPDKKNAILEDLKKLEYGKHTRQYYNKTRDNKDIKVLKCEDSEALFLNKTDHIKKGHYEQATDYFNDDPINEADTERRAELIKPYLLFSDWLDIGTGQGKILDKLKEYFGKHIHCIEPQETGLQERGYKTYKDISEVNKKFDLITMFHVLEHIPNQIEYLKKVFNKLKDEGQIIIEVPHARDILIETCEAFRKHTFWSEHLILHTDKTLIELLLHCGFDEIQVIYEQRYPLSNHMYWKKYGKPGGHKHLNCDALSEIRNRNHLIKARKTDTIIVIAKRP